MIGGEAISFDLDRDGADFVAGLALDIIGELEKTVAHYGEGQAGVRITGRPELAELLGQSHAIGAYVAHVLGRQAHPVRAVLFDKSDAGNWALGWHQDRTITVVARKEVEGFGSWTCKQGIQHVEPPFAVMDRMVTARIHLDDVDQCNAPLLIALGSHRRGRIPVGGVEDAVAQANVHACLATRGDVWLYRTAILHASARAMEAGRHRRVLQVDYAALDLPGGLEWLGI
ncbi:MAG: phytanoyl-CoA dioxygenase family protein [Novosphingobium sp.]